VVRHEGHRAMQLFSVTRRFLEIAVGAVLDRAIDAFSDWRGGF